MWVRSRFKPNSTRLISPQAQERNRTTGIISRPIENLRLVTLSLGVNIKAVIY